MEIQLGQVIRNEEKSFLAAIRAVSFRGAEFDFDIPAGFVEGFCQEGHVFVGTLDIVKRRLGFVAHCAPFRPPADMFDSIVSQLENRSNGPEEAV